MKENFYSFRNTSEIVLEDYLQPEILNQIENGYCPFDKNEPLSDSNCYILTSRYKNIGGNISLLGQITTKSHYQFCYVRISEKTFKKLFRRYSLINNLVKYISWSLIVFWAAIALLTQIENTKTIYQTFAANNREIILMAFGITGIIAFLGYYLYAPLLLHFVKNLSKVIVKKDNYYNKVGYWVRDFDGTLFVKDPLKTKYSLHKLKK